MSTPKIGKKMLNSEYMVEVIADQLEYEYANYSNGNTASKLHFTLLISL